MEEIKIFAPATVANLSCGFDVLGCCLQNVGDEMLLKKNDLNQLRSSALFQDHCSILYSIDFTV